MQVNTANLNHQIRKPSKWGGGRSKVGYSLFFVIINLVTVFKGITSSVLHYNFRILAGL